MVLANVGPDEEAEFNRWYDREHMRERVEVPGFTSAQRYVAAGSPPWKYLALYQTESLSTFSSPVYRQALANQSAWSKRVLTRFRDPQRCVAERTLRFGYGIGGAVSLTLIRPRVARADHVRELLATEILPSLAAQEGVIEASLLECDPALSKPVAEYPTSAIDLVTPDDWFVVLAGVGTENVSAEIGAVGGELVEISQRIGTFTLLWDLHRADL